MHGQLSNTLRITNVNDFLAPSTACVLPLGGGAVPAGSVLAPIIPTEQKTAQAAVAKVTVSDCLSCSGCVTSAETVLLSTENLDMIRTFIRKRLSENPSKFAIATLSQQSVASIAVHYKISLSSAARKIATFLKGPASFDVVIDNSFARHVSLVESASEYLQRYRDGKKLTIASACPGWVTYAEKTQEMSVIDCMSLVRSSQGIIGAIAECVRPKDDSRPVWVLSVAQCHDKKLESIRPELAASPNDLQGGREGREIDCVLTTGELVELMEEMKFDLLAAEETDLSSSFHPSSSSSQFGVAVGSGSDGYADFILRVAAKELLNIDIPTDAAVFKKSSKSGDVRVATISNEDGSKQLRFATAYGFRSLQSILRKIRRGECSYDYIELMACPGGCNNGGGQLPPPMLSEDDLRSTKQHSADHLRLVDDVFSQAPAVDSPLEVPSIRRVYKDILGGHVGSSLAEKKTRLVIESRKSSAVLSLDW